MALVNLDIKKLQKAVVEAKAHIKPNTKKEEPEKKEEGDDDKHLIDMGGSGGNLSRGDGHPYWGYRYMAGLCDDAKAGISDGGRAKARRKIYNEFPFVDQVYAADAAKLIKANFKFPLDGGSAGNFCQQAKKAGKTCGQKFPYRWQSHHLVPDEIYNTGKKPIFNDEEKKLLIAAGYNINHGHNIIFLPGSGGMPYVAVHGLSQHYGSHPKYSKAVKKEMDKVASPVKKELKKAKEKVGEDPHAKIKVGVVKRLREAEQSMWENLTEASHIAIKKKLANAQHDVDYLVEKQGWFKLS